MMCPAVMFAAKRTERDMGLARYANNSIKIMRGAISIGVPEGKKNLKKLVPCLQKPIKVTARKINALREKVIAIWLVTEKL